MKPRLDGSKVIRLRELVGVCQTPALAWVGFLGLVLSLTPAHACLPIGRYGARVDVAEETAIIIWDKETKTEHFIRRARFLTEAKDLGFLVPTPTKPELVEVENFVFDSLWQYTNPPPPAPPSRAKFPAPANKAPDAVKVLETKTLAGYDAAILEAKNPKALTEWLKKNDYPTTADTEAWLQTYIQDGWIITAFKISNATQGPPRFQTSTVRMTFQTEKPFYPYREKAGAGTSLSERLLRLYFLSQDPHEGSLAGTPWDVEIPFAKRIDAGFQKRLETQLNLPAQTGPAKDPWFLTEFVDHATVRKSGGEVFFLPNPDMPTRDRKVVSVPWTSASSSNPDLDALKAMAPVGLTFMGLLVVCGWIWLRPKNPGATP